MPGEKVDDHAVVIRGIRFVFCHMVECDTVSEGVLTQRSESLPDMPEKLFLSLDSSHLACEIGRAVQNVCYAAPGILKEPAEALAECARKIGPEMITVCLDFDERVMRMGYGTLDAVEVLRDAGVEVRTVAGLRTGLVVIDDTGYIFTPNALYLEADKRSDTALNAMRLSEEQVKEALARLSPGAKAIAVAMARTDEERERIREQAVEMPSEKVEDANFANVQKRLAEAPPANFDVARQVRVYSAYVQYVEIKLTGAAIQRHRFAIPPSIQKLGGSEELKDRLKTTFDLIERDGKLSSKELEDNLDEIRRNFTPSLGKVHGRVVLNAAKPHLEEKLKEFRGKLKAHQETVEKELQGKLDESRKQIIDYYVSKVIEDPPDGMRGQFPEIGEEEVRKWLDWELEPKFPKAENLLEKMQLDVNYKDVTFETLNREEFIGAIKKAFPLTNWDKAYSDYLAARESKD